MVTRADKLSCEARPAERSVCSLRWAYGDAGSGLTGGCSSLRVLAATWEPEFQRIEGVPWDMDQQLHQKSSVGFSGADLHTEAGSCASFTCMINPTVTASKAIFFLQIKTLLHLNVCI